MEEKLITEKDVGFSTKTKRKKFEPFEKYSKRIRHLNLESRELSHINSLEKCKKL